MEVPDPRAAVNALKGVLGETTKQTDIANIFNHSINDQNFFN